MLPRVGFLFRARLRTLARPLLLPLGIAFLAAVPRFVSLDTVPGFEHDEANALNLARAIYEGEPSPLHGVQIYQGPLFYYLVAASFKLFGVSVFAGRAVNALLGVLTVVASFYLAQRLFGWRTGFLTGLLMALLPWHVALSRVAWESSMVPFFALMALILALEAIYRHEERLLPFAGLALGIAMNGHLYALLLLGVILSWLLLTKPCGGWLRRPPFFFTLFLVLVPNLPLLWYNIAHGYPTLSWYFASGEQFRWQELRDPVRVLQKASGFLWTVHHSLDGQYIWPDFYPANAGRGSLLWPFLFWSGIVFGGIQGVRRHSRSVLFLGIWFGLISLALPQLSKHYGWAINDPWWLIGDVWVHPTPVWYLDILYPLPVIVMAQAVVSLLSVVPWRRIALFLFLGGTFLLTTMMGQDLYRLYFEPFASGDVGRWEQGLEEVVRLVRSQPPPTGVLYVADDYYGGYPQLRFLVGDFAVLPEKVVQEVEGQGQQTAYWISRQRMVGRSPVFVSRYENWFAYEVHSPLLAQSAAIPTNTEKPLGPNLALIGFALSSERLRAGEELAVTTYWRVLRPPPADYTLFVHLRDEAHRKWGQLDRRPLQGKLLTSQWVPETIIEETTVLTVAPDAPRGQYWLDVGMYEWPSLQRIGVPPHDVLTLGPVTVGR